MYFITTKRMLEVCFSAHPNIQYRTNIITGFNSAQFAVIDGGALYAKPPVLGMTPPEAGDNQRPERTGSGAAKTFAYFPLHDQPPTGTEDSASPLTTPAPVRSGRVLHSQLNKS